MLNPVNGSFIKKKRMSNYTHRQHELLKQKGVVTQTLLYSEHMRCCGVMCVSICTQTWRGWSRKWLLQVPIGWEAEREGTACGMASGNLVGRLHLPVGRKMAGLLNRMYILHIGYMGRKADFHRESNTGSLTVPVIPERSQASCL